MIIKGVLAVSIIALSTLTGYLISLNYEIRIKQLTAFIYSIKVMETEMSYSKNFLMDIIKKLSLNNEKIVSYFYKNMADFLDRSYGEDFSTIWCASADISLEASALSGTDKKIIKDFGKNLGKMDMKNQQKIFDYFYKRFELQLEEAINEKIKKSRVYKNLGVAAGVMVVVVLI